MIHVTLTMLIDRFDSSAVRGSDVIDWCCPVPTFGDVERARVATMGINPSNREFVDQLGAELDGGARRFQTLNSLNLESWADADSSHLRQIIQSCQLYFLRNPYNRWFNILDGLLSGIHSSFYTQPSNACHLDLVPYTTARKWMELSSTQKADLLDVSRDTLAVLLRDSPVRTLILNGKTVVTRFEKLAEINLLSREVPGWSLARRKGADVVGVSYVGQVTKLAGIDLGRSISVLGFNHNLQSSFGVTTSLLRAIRDWVAQRVGDIGK